MSLFHKLLNTHQCTFIGKKMHPTAQDTSHTAEVFHPFRESRFIFSLWRNGNIDSTQGINRHQEFGNHHFTMRTFQQTFGQMSEERVDNICFPVQTDHNIRSFILLDCMDNPRSNIQVIATHHRNRHISGSGNHSRLLQITFTLLLFLLRTVIVIDNVQCHQCIFLLSILYY